MSVWIPPGHRTHDGQPDCDVRWCECSGRCTSNAPCDCCELAELRIEVERLTAERDALRAGGAVAQAAAGKRIAELSAEVEVLRGQVARVRKVMAGPPYTYVHAALLYRALDGGES